MSAKQHGFTCDGVHFDPLLIKGLRKQPDIEFPTKIKKDIRVQGICAYDYLIILFCRDSKNKDNYIWFLDLNNHKWFISKYKTPFITELHFFSRVMSNTMEIQLYF